MPTWRFWTEKAQNWTVERLIQKNILFHEWQKQRIMASSSRSTNNLTSDVPLKISTKTMTSLRANFIGGLCSKRIPCNATMKYTGGVIQSFNAVQPSHESQISLQPTRMVLKTTSAWPVSLRMLQSDYATQVSLDSLYSCRWRDI